MNLLAIESSHASLSVAVSSGGGVFELCGSEWSRAAETIMPLVQQVLRNSHTEKERLDAVAVSSGPGSFTALRIGMSAAKGIAYGLGIPLVSVPTLPAMAVAAMPYTSAGAIVSFIPSRKGEYYYGCYPRALLEKGMAGDESARGSAEDVVAAACGMGPGTVVTARHAADFSTLPECGEVCFIDASFFSAASLLPEAIRLFGQGSTQLPADASPDYRQMFMPGGRKE